MAALYADEDFSHPVGEQLRKLGHDVLTAQDDGQANKKVPDIDVLARATSLGRAVITHNRRDYIRLHKASSQHAGIVVCTHDPDTDALAQNIHDALTKLTDLTGLLVRVTRQAKVP